MLATATSISILKPAQGKFANLDAAMSAFSAFMPPASDSMRGSRQAGARGATT
ncbi:hypothetical protein [Massilia violaceinigra]|uniref:hypothetical protein n=1 Tax=Massilia violaceinigra TaxID=2045208 RepID=UPI001E2F5D58|nr:hypothetical protein [Massilia violaceinigra]